MNPPIAVVLLNMGGPDSLEAVEPFLYNLFRDPDLIPLPLGFLWQRRFARMVSRARAQKVAEYYRLRGWDAAGRPREPMQAGRAEG